MLLAVVYDEMSEANAFGGVEPESGLELEQIMLTLPAPVKIIFYFNQFLRSASADCFE